ncbi:MAG: tRNA (5-methylaminomethyl-2-thiouridine)(34)-methyltransferase MnmD [Raineya sp.]|jgi:tRNA U34 5-methylaminomethyl-2-thiouridine-forming methyltransferase MnmC|nr:tRNA (5-methylaminomethyl-2-thiouridine)(34)-methyltransferase MnmD [Raineya sp.]
MIEIFETKDGSKTLLNTALNETYHSRFGAIQESIHVFIEAGLNTYLKQFPDNESIHILEVGFGTGLNAILTLQAVLNTPYKVYYETLETYPLSLEQVEELNYIEQIGDHLLNDYFKKMHTCNWDEPVEIHPNFTICKKKQPLETYHSEKDFHIIYFDAFAPNVQPELWTLEALQNSTQKLIENGIFVTYCAKGQLKRDLKSLHLQVESLSGPPGKREMTRGIKVIKT